MQAPQINRQTARHGYDGLLAHCSQGARAFAQDGQTLLHRRILRLKAHHAPGALYQCGADPRITALGHAAWNALTATCAFAGTKPGLGADGATIVEPMPIADLARKHDAGELTHSPRQGRWSGGLQFTC